MSGTTENVLSRMSFNGFCPTATGYVAMGQIKIYVGTEAGLSAGPKNCEMLKFDEIQVFSIFINMDGVNDVFSWFSGENMNFKDFSTFCEMSGLWMRILDDVKCSLKLHG